MTEEEALKKWCPFSRVISDFYEHPNPDVQPTFTPPVCNRIQWDDGSLLGEAVNCMGSECMAWRELPSTKCIQRNGKLSDRDLDGTGLWKKEGYCGLAGKP